ncbi:spermidine/putrescine ABC transporter ATP-binding protein [Desulfosarcina ovata subsp. sediminis]|uniref:Spermidine/putrescine ABC transporter ATP-binding protein n=1 Tax=Desulfosarcina ovata subsp. sediminis TaxID=885957 RepID=A0A5K8A0L8_9BACT|nr:ABC transporter ATP-binding protein [Desulfosarcina ovata]BBO85931.1 spermidine/putrescine ABC transporter ATP-binding protein [Desulfosarcina ovata subsp. sediminis]
MPLLSVKNLAKAYDQPAVDEVSFGLAEGEILCLLGPSGCGKTTLLRLIAGLESPDTGQVFINDQNMTTIPPHRRNFGLMFQEFALFPHKSVFDNVAFGLEMKRLPVSQIRTRTEAMLERVGLAGMARRSVAELSGGERQRVALARSLAPQPRLLMLDEPLGALDRALRERLLMDIHGILKRLETTAIFVTHDQSEALAVADRVAVMNAGRLEQVDPPETLYRHPQSLFVARFLGFENLLAGTLAGDGGIDTVLGRLYPSALPDGMQPGDRVSVILRPEGARVADRSAPPLPIPPITGRVVSRIFSGQSYRTGIAITDETTLTFHLPSETSPPGIGETIALDLSPSAMAIIPEAWPHPQPKESK